MRAAVQVAWDPKVYRAPYSIDAQGRPMLLCRSGGALDNALTRNDAVVICFGCHRGQMWISGWAAPVIDREAALDFAARNPHNDLLAVGRGFGLYRIDVAEVRVAHRGGEPIEIDLDDYVSSFSGPVT